MYYHNFNILFIYTLSWAFLTIFSQLVTSQQTYMYRLNTGFHRIESLASGCFKLNQILFLTYMGYYISKRLTISEIVSTKKNLPSIKFHWNKITNAFRQYLLINVSEYFIKYDLILLKCNCLHDSRDIRKLYNKFLLNRTCYLTELSTW